MSLNIVNEFKYLGIKFSTSGSFSSTQLAMAEKGMKALFALQKNLQDFTDITYSHTLSLYDKLVVPVFTYGCEVWGFHKADKIERVQIQFFKRLIRARRSTPNNIVLGELGRQPLRNIRLIRIVSYWLKILHSNSDRYINKIYTVLVEDALNGKVNWVSQLMNLLLTLGLGEAWYYQGVGNIDVFMCVFRQRLTDVFLPRVA
jgi:hypothetical protein